MSPAGEQIEALRSRLRTLLQRLSDEQREVTLARAPLVTLFRRSDFL